MTMATERLPSTGRRQDCGKYLILGYADWDMWFNKGVLLNIARQIEMKVFGVERDFAIQDVTFNFRTGGSMTVVADAVTEEPLGYSSHRILAPMLEGNRRRIMFTTTRAIRKEFQGEGMGPETVRFSFNMHGAPDLVAGIMGWAPPVCAYYKSGVVAELGGEEKRVVESAVELSGDDELDEINKMRATTKLYPLFRRFNQSELITEAVEYTLKQSRYSGIHYDPETGLMPGLWDKDSMMLYQADKASRRVEVIGEWLKNEFHCNPSNGDAILVMGPKKGWRAFID